jgi:hypothetical protein
MATSPSLADLTATIASLQAQVAELTEHRNLQETIAPTASDPGYITGEEVDVFFLLFGGVLVFWMQVRGPRPPGIASTASPSAPSPRAPPVPRARRRASRCSRSVL